jgi:nicotinate-nucleotide pyrophosphorylase (carboxylating)
MPKHHLALPHLHSTFRTLLLEGLREDGFSLDWTSMGLRRDRNVKVKIVAKSEGVFFGAQIASAAAAVSEEIGLPFKIRTSIPDGKKVKEGERVIELVGNATGILALERPTLNLAGYLSGIATRTRVLADRTATEWAKKKYPGSPPRITATRKILPHYRDAAIAAVMAGGGFSHRVNLAGGILIKENHIAAYGGLTRAIEKVRSLAPHGLKIEVEVTNLDEFKEALQSKAEIILLDNFIDFRIIVFLNIM